MNPGKTSKLSVSYSHLAIALSISVFIHGVVLLVLAFGPFDRSHMQITEQSLNVVVVDIKGNSSPGARDYGTSGKAISRSKTKTASTGTPSASASMRDGNHASGNTMPSQTMPVEHGESIPNDSSSTQEKTPSSFGDGTPGATDTSPGQGHAVPTDDDFLPQSKITDVPVVPTREILSKIEYPPLAARQEIQATVILELFIDQTGEYGFADAAILALTGMVCKPALVNGHPVAVRYRYPVSFVLK